MFRNKKKKRAIILLNADGAVIQTIYVDAFQLPEDTVIKLSVKFYNDPEPCEIHRAAVRDRALMELEERCPVGQTVAVDESMTGFFPEGTHFIQLVEVN